MSPPEEVYTLVKAHFSNARMLPWSECGEQFKFIFSQAVYHVMNKAMGANSRMELAES